MGTTSIYYLFLSTIVEETLSLTCVGLFHFQLFNTVQEKAVEEQMVATKDIVMEPTIKSLNDDLVIMNFLLNTYISTLHGTPLNVEAS